MKNDIFSLSALTCGIVMLRCSVSGGMLGLFLYSGVGNLS